jgi:rSAM/selenodomain-associated transferase 2
MSDKISIIMPVYNEAKGLAATLDVLTLSLDEELIVVDGGSTDATVSIAQQYTEKTYTAKTGRASVMNYGAQHAEGNVLLFLHADCQLPGNAFQLIRDILKDRSIAAGAFHLAIEHEGWAYRLIEYMARLRSRCTGMLYGDQGMFLRKEVFDRIGGFADIPLMEDIEISQRLKKEGRVVFADASITASARRWIDEGVVFTTLRDWAIAFLYTFMKVSPEKLIRHYGDSR